MSTEPPELTILLGPTTALSYTLNTIAREQRGNLMDASLKALPMRLAAPLLNQFLDASIPSTNRRARLVEAGEGMPLFLSTIKFFGKPSDVFAGIELFPGAAQRLLPLLDVVANPRIVLTVDPVPEFFLVQPSHLILPRVKKTTWDVLYELSWAKLIQDILVALPGCEVIALTHRSSAVHVLEMLSLLFGSASNALTNPYLPLRTALNETGQIVYDRLAGRPPDLPTREDLYSGFANRTQFSDLKEKLGLDKTTAILLEQRFEEDLAMLRAMPQVSVF